MRSQATSFYPLILQHQTIDNQLARPATWPMFCRLVDSWSIYCFLTMFVDIIDSSTGWKVELLSTFWSTWVSTNNFWFSNLSIKLTRKLVVLTHDDAVDTWSDWRIFTRMRSIYCVVTAVRIRVLCVASWVLIFDDATINWGSWTIQNKTWLRSQRFEHLQISSG